MIFSQDPSCKSRRIATRGGINGVASAAKWSVRGHHVPRATRLPGLLRLTYGRECTRPLGGAGLGRPPRDESGSIGAAAALDPVLPCLRELACARRAGLRGAGAGSSAGSAAST
jgi:hypothetical protein